MPVVRVSTQAEADIDSIAEYTKDTWGEIQADSYLMKLKVVSNSWLEIL
jgi:plasmid stabilization system protein ParE